MSDIKVSIFGSWARPISWHTILHSLATNTIQYEVVIAGPNTPDFELPPNVKFIHTQPDPGVCYCAQIAANQCNGETFVMVPDDLVYSANALDILYAKYKQENDYKYVIHPRWGTGPNDDTTEHQAPYMFLTPDPEFRCGVGVLFSKQVFRELGGYDRRYNAGPYDADFQYRVRSIGGRYIYASSAFVQQDMKWAVNDAGAYDGAWVKLNAGVEVAMFHNRWHSNGEFAGGTLLSTPTTPFEPIIFPENDRERN